MKTKENLEKVLETTLLAALNRKIYRKQMLDEHPGKLAEKDYSEASKECIDACSKLFMHYAENRIK